MEFKTIAIHVSRQDLLKRQIAAADQIIAAKGGHLKGIFVMPPLPQPVEFVFPASDDYLRDLQNEYGKLAEAARSEFLHLTNDRHFAGEWQLVEGAIGSIAQGIISEARTSDLVVITHRRQSAESLDVRLAPERVILETGRPILLLPESAEAKLDGARITIAWANRREAARAAFDALPLLKKAREIRILTIDETRRRSGAPADVPPADIAAALSRHGLNVDIASCTPDGSSSGEQILSQIATDGTDVLVMGGYGHSRLRELVLGGVTRDILDKAEIPVLMSH